MKNSAFLIIWCNLLLFVVLPIEASHELLSKFYQHSDLYVESKSFNEGYLQVSDQHNIFFAEFGNPDGVPVIAVHGGPGSQCYASWSAFFDLNFYRLIMFDQRGSGRSKPFAEMNENTPQHSIDDMEKLRKNLSIDKWVLFGGSYGSFLSLLYGETHPENCLGFILRGVCLGRECDYQHLFYGMKSYFPEAFDEMVKDIPENERSNLISYFHKQVMNKDPCIHMAAAKAFMRFDTYCAHLLPNLEEISEVETNIISTLGIARGFIHYSANGFFVEENQILDHLDQITHIPAYIVQGRYDLICPPSGAYELYKKWPFANLWIISDAGHATSEFGISQGIKDAAESLKLNHLKQ